MDELSEAELRRYARQIVLPEIGGEGQLRLRRAGVLVVGVGGLGSPLLLYLAAAGVGRLGVVDDDVVDPSNLHRQVLFETGDTGRGKVEVALARLRRLNPLIELAGHPVRLDAGNALGIVGGYDLVADGSDNFATRALVQDACLRLGRPLVSGSVQGLDGQLTTFKPHLGPPHPCLRCLFPEEPAGDALPSCAQGGVLGPAAAVVAGLQATEVVKEIVGFGRSLSGSLMLYDAAEGLLERVALRRRPACVHGCARLGTAGGA
jgi:molybdopterin/thiamine biosynthesis adenylyltransferase